MLINTNVPPLQYVSLGLYAGAVSRGIRETEPFAKIIDHSGGSAPKILLLALFFKVHWPCF